MRDNLYFDGFSGHLHMDGFFQLLNRIAVRNQRRSLYSAGVDQIDSLLNSLSAVAAPKSQTLQLITAVVLTAVALAYALWIWKQPE